MSKSLKENPEDQVDQPVDGHRSPTELVGLTQKERELLILALGPTETTGTPFHPYQADGRIASHRRATRGRR